MAVEASSGDRGSEAVMFTPQLMHSSSTCQVNFLQDLLIAYTLIQNVFHINLVHILLHLAPTFVANFFCMQKMQKQICLFS